MGRGPLHARISPVSPIVSCFSDRVLGTHFPRLCERSGAGPGLRSPLLGRPTLGDPCGDSEASDLSDGVLEIVRELLYSGESGVRGGLPLMEPELSLSVLKAGVFAKSTILWTPY